MKPSEYFDFERITGSVRVTPEKNDGIIEVEEPILELAEVGSYKLKNFSAINELTKIKGPLIEIGGPTDSGFELIDIKALPKEILVSNLGPGARLFFDQCDTDINESNKYYGRVDFQADGQNLPIRDESAGAIFIRCLGNIKEPDRIIDPIEDAANDLKLKTNVINEVYRVLENGGIFILERIQSEYFEFAKKAGFKLKQYKISRRGFGSFIFKKETDEMNREAL